MAIAGAVPAVCARVFKHLALLDSAAIAAVHFSSAIALQICKAAAGGAQGRPEKKAARSPQEGDRAAGSSQNKLTGSAEGVGGNHFSLASMCSGRML